MSEWKAMAMETPDLYTLGVRFCTKYLGAWF